MAKHYLIQTAEATCSKAISNAKAQTTSQAAMFQEEHYNYLQSLEEQASGKKVDVAMMSSPPVRLPYTTPHIQLGGCWLYPAICYWGKHLHCPHLFSLQGPLPWKNRHPQLLLPCQCPNSLQDQKGAILCQSQQGTCHWVELPQQLQWEDLLALRNEKPLPGLNY